MNRDARGRFVRTVPLPALTIPPAPTPIYVAVVCDQGFDPIADRADHAIEHARKEREK